MDKNLVNIKHSLILILGLLVSQGTNASEVPQMFTLDGQLAQVGTESPLLDSSVRITIQILDSSKTCLLYEETQYPIDTTATNGYYNIQIGSSFPNAKRTGNDPGRTMTQVFQNASPITANNAPGQTCTGGAYTPTTGATRYFRLIVTPSSTNIADTLLPDTPIDSVPNAMVANSVQGLGPGELLQVKTTGSNVLSQANLESVFTSSYYANLMALLAIPATSSVVQTPTNGGATLPSVSGNPSSPAAGQIWYDSVANVLKYYDGAVKTLGTSGGAVGNQSANTFYAGPSSGGAAAPSFRTIASADLPVSGVTASTYRSVTVDTYGRVTAGTNPTTLAGYGITDAVASGGQAGALTIGTTDATSLTLNTNNTAKVTVLSGGNVGISTTAPTAPLTVGPNPVAVFNSNELLQLAKTGDAYMTISDGTGRFLMGTTAGLPFIGTQSATDFTLRSNNLDRVRLTSGGNVGINTTNPQALLEVLTSSNTTGLLLHRGSSAANSHASIGFRNSASAGGATAEIRVVRTDIPTSGDNAILFFNNKAGGMTESMRIDSYGNVGIGAAPTYRLDVAGDINTTTCFRIGATTVSGTCTSDERLKEDIQDYKGGLPDLLKIKLHTYKFNGMGEMPKTGEIAVGVIAQEVEKTNPELVKTRLVKMHSNDTDKTEIKVVDYSKFSYMLINAVKELYHKWFEDHARIEKLEALVEQQDQEIRNLKTYLCQKDSEASICR